jgi:D-glycero-alpha-D-manno-heptose-7-phosphate kinase
MIVACAPFRIGLAGGGSDIPSFYRKYRGAVLSAAIAKYAFVVVHPYFDEQYFHLKYSKTELTRNRDEIQHPILREVLAMLDIKRGLEIASIADVPAGTGIGSSSAFCVALLNALHAHCGKFVTKERLAKEACCVEIERLGEPIGKQDQYATAFGGINFIEFETNDAVLVNPLPLDQDVAAALENNLLLFFTGIQRSASAILSEQKKSIEKCQDSVDTLRRMVDIAYRLRETLMKGDLDSVGTALHESWLLKRSLATQISSSHIDRLYEMALTAGATGGKIAGAGGGGFLLLYCPVERQAAVRDALKDYEETEFRFDAGGTRVIFAS